MRTIARYLSTLVLSGACVHAGDDLAGARGIFRREIARAYGIADETITVQPQHPGLPDNPFDPLKTGDLFAFRADWPGVDPGPGGFASADGRVAFARSDQGVAALLLACGVDRPDFTMPLSEVIRRLAWIYRSAGEPVEGPRHRHTLTRDGDAVEIVWHTRKAGATGSFSHSRLTVRLLPDGRTETRSEACEAVVP